MIDRVIKLRGHDNYIVDFSPTDEQIEEIEKWLVDEISSTGEGLFHDWDDIISLYRNKELLIVSTSDETIGFIAWRIKSARTAKIEYAQVKSKFKRQGVGRILVAEVLEFLKKKQIDLVDLRCISKTAETIWKRLGFTELPEPPDKYCLNEGKKKTLYFILSDNQPTSSGPSKGETIELWNEEPYMIKKNTPPTYTWNIDFVKETRKLVKPIIHPAHHRWQMQWRIGEKIIWNGEVGRFRNDIYSRLFIIIDELPVK